MSLEGFRGETSQSAFPRIAWTAEGAEAGRVQPWPRRPLACGRAGPGPRGDGGGDVLVVSVKKEAEQLK